MLVFAGASPFTQAGEMRGSRNEFIQWIQDVPDQRGLVRGYVRYENEIRVGANARQIVHRALQIVGILGYKNDSPFSLGRHYRDALSGSLMISNERIAAKNASMLLVYKDAA